MRLLEAYLKWRLGSDPNRRWWHSQYVAIKRERAERKNRPIEVSYEALIQDGT